MRRPRVRPLAPTLTVALRAGTSLCYRHCERPVRATTIPSPLPGLLQVYACPSGVVSITSYAEWGPRDPREVVRAFLRRRTVPPSLVRPRDLRGARRHGPELGARAERFLAARPDAPPVRVVYWRVYPFRAPDGSARRLFVCRRRAHRAPVFYAAPPESGSAECPVCARRSRRTRRAPRTRGGATG